MDAACAAEPQVEQTPKIPVDVANWQLLCWVWQLQSPKEVSTTVWYVMRKQGTNSGLALLAGGSVA